MRKLVFLLLLLLLPSIALADGIALSHVTLDWTGLVFTVTPGLTITRLDQPLLRVDEPKAETAGLGTGAVSIVNGYFNLLATAPVTLASPLDNRAQAPGGIAYNFFVEAMGQGLMTLTVPYSLEVSCNADDLFDAWITANAWAELTIGPSGFMRDQVATTCSEGPKSGVLSVWRGINTPNTGTLVNISLYSEAGAAAHVPEPSSILLLGLGIAALSSWIVQKQSV